MNESPELNATETPAAAPERAVIAAWVIGVLAISWGVGALAGWWGLPRIGEWRESTKTTEELASMGVRYFGGLGLYIGAQLAVLRAFRVAGRPEAALRWRKRFWSFHFTVLLICALGATLGAILFPLVGSLVGVTKTPRELAIFGAKTGGFFFMVWAPGVALVREFVRAGRKS